MPAGLSVPQLIEEGVVVVVPWPPELAVKEGWQERLIAEAPQMLKNYGLQGLMCQHSLASKKLAKRLKENGLFLHVWTVDDPDLAISIADMGADDLITNNPPLIRAALAANC